MEIKLVPAESKHVNELGRICFEAFKSIHDRHAFPRDFPTLESALKAIDMLVHSEEFYGVVALIDGRPVGSNFLSLMDSVAGVGPITVDPGCQTRGIGRALMKDVVDYARNNKMQQVRLLQDSFNMASLSLYSSLGFNVKETVVLMEAAPSAKADKSVRPVAQADLPAIEELSRRIYKVSRRDEVAFAHQNGFPIFLREKGGRVTGYSMPGLFGHSVAETEEDAISLIGESVRALQPESSLFFCPLREPELYRKALGAGCRALKVMNLMTIGPYDPPDEFWMPSVLY